MEFADNVKESILSSKCTDCSVEIYKHNAVRKFGVNFINRWINCAKILARSVQIMSKAYI